MAKIHSTKNMVSTLKIINVTTKYSKIIKKYIVDFYKNLFVAANDILGDLSVVRRMIPSLIKA